MIVVQLLLTRRGYLHFLPHDSQEMDGFEPKRSNHFTPRQLERNRPFSLGSILHRFRTLLLRLHPTERTSRVQRVADTTKLDQCEY